MRLTIIIIAVSLIALYVGAIEATKAVTPIIKRVVV